MHLIKPAIMEILSEQPYVSSLFLHCFVSLSRDSSINEESTYDEKALEEHIVKGYYRVSYR
jgi:hypothetical protein